MPGRIHSNPHSYPPTHPPPGNVPKGTLAKLSVAVVERMDKCVSNFRARAGTHFARLDPDFLLYLTFMP